jgi:hypothetical protein
VVSKENRRLRLPTTSCLTFSPHMLMYSPHYLSDQPFVVHLRALDRATVRLCDVGFHSRALGSVPADFTRDP